MNKFRSRAFDVLWAMWTALFALAIPVLRLVGVPASTVRRASRLWVLGTLGCLRHVVGLTYVERGRENIPAEPCLIVANHQSTWETVASLVLFPNVAIVAKEELLDIPVFGWYLRHSPMIIIDRETGASAIRKMVDESRVALESGRSVLIFPEGTRKSVSDPVEFKRGVELLYAMLKVPVLPVAVNSGQFWGIDHTAKRGGTITVSYLPPIMPGQTGAQFTRAAEALLEAEKMALR